MHPTFEVFGVTLHSYGLMLVLAALAGTGLAAWRAPRYGVQRDDTLYCIIYACIGALIGAKLLYLITVIPKVIQNWSVFQGNFWLLVQYLLGGLVFYGGFLGGAAGLMLYLKHYKVPVWPMVNALVPAIPLAHAIGRVGCFLGGCCYGIPVSWGVCMSPLGGAPEGVPLLPVQLIESGYLLLLSGVLLLLSRRIHRTGGLLGTYLIAYGVERFILEFFRYDAIRGVWGGLSTSQWISLALLPIGVALFFLPLDRLHFTRQGIRIDPIEP